MMHMSATIFETVYRAVHVPFVTTPPSFFHDPYLAACVCVCVRACPAALNMSVFMLIGRSSALTMNIAGVIKDWMLILLSMILYK